MRIDMTTMSLEEARAETERRQNKRERLNTTILLSWGITWCAWLAWMPLTLLEPDLPTELKTVGSAVLAAMGLWVVLLIFVSSVRHHQEDRQERDDVWTRDTPEHVVESLAEPKPMKISIPPKSDAPRTKTAVRMDVTSLLKDRDQRVLLVDGDPTPGQADPDLPARETHHDQDL
jgi:hypothetical protein